MADKIRVLIAEDNAVLRQSLTDLLSREGDLEVVARAPDGVEAVRLANVWRPDVALLDIQMPRLDGVEAARQIAQARPQTKIVMLTTFDNDDLVFRAIVAGAVGYLLKGAQDEEIVGAVREAMRGYAPLSPAIARAVIDDFRRIKQPRTPEPPAPGAEPLTERESAVLDQICLGKSNRAIAASLGLAEGTVKNYVSNILSKLHARSRTELAARGAR